MRSLLESLIGTYTPVQVSNNLYIDVPYLLCGLLIIVVIYALIRGVIYLICNRQ